MTASQAEGMLSLRQAGCAVGQQASLGIQFVSTRRAQDDRAGASVLPREWKNCSTSDRGAHGAVFFTPVDSHCSVVESPAVVKW